MSENISVIREELPEILNELTDAIANAKSLSQADRLHGVWVRNNLARDLHEDVETLEPFLHRFLMKQLITQSWLPNCLLNTTNVMWI